MAVYQMGPNTLPIPMTVFRNNRQRLVNELLNSKCIASDNIILDNNAFILLQGGSDISLHDTDVDFLFRQESFFQYLFGVKEPHCFGVIHIKSGRSTLFVPKLPTEYAVWMGKLHTLDDFRKMYETDEVLYCDELKNFFTDAKPSVILTLNGINSDSGLPTKPATFDGIENQYRAAVPDFIRMISSGLREYCSSSSSDDNYKSGGLKNDKIQQRLGQTTILVQQGSDIQELPVILRKIKSSDEFGLIVCDEKVKDLEDNTQRNLNVAIGHREIEINPEDIIVQLDNCTTLSELLSVIDEIPDRFLCPEIAANALDKLIRNESVVSLNSLEMNNPTFEKLVDCIIKNGDHKMLLDFMEVLKTFLDLQKTVQRFCDELLLRNSDGILNIVEICECIDRFVDCKQNAAAEKFWTGISDAEKTINDKTIKFVYKILPKLKISRRLVISLLERRIGNFWWLLTPESVTESIVALTESKLANRFAASSLAKNFTNGAPPIRTMQYFARWLNINIHAVSEVHLEKIINSMTKLEFSNNEVEKALERYVKAKGIRIKQDKLVAEILDHCVKFSRVIKSAEEIEILRYVAKVSSDAHKKVMKMMKPGMCEYQGESEFLHHSYSVGGCRHTSYTCICGTGTNSAILHYGHASAPNMNVCKNGDMCLFDMGANYGGYAADITCSFPVNGKFTDDQKLIYNAVLAARNAVLESVKEGVSWVDMHLLANKVMLTKLIEGNLLKGDVNEMIAVGLNGILQPHGLGHLLGLDVHDVGGYLPDQPARPTAPGVNKLRFARTLKAGMYLTVEPGCYFVDCLMDSAINDPKMVKYINVNVFERFRNFGGVRIEDDVLITKDGCENFAIVPRTVEEIEAWMAQ